MSEDRVKGPKELFYEQRIYGLMDKIAKACIEGGISVVASFELDCEAENNRTMMCSTILLRRGCVKNLIDCADALGVPEEIRERGNRAFDGMEEDGHGPRQPN